jgi:hypothetical protein
LVAPLLLLLLLVVVVVVLVDNNLDHARLCDGFRQRQQVKLRKQQRLVVEAVGPLDKRVLLLALQWQRSQVPHHFCFALLAKYSVVEVAGHHFQPGIPNLGRLRAKAGGSSGGGSIGRSDGSGIGGASRVFFFLFNASSVENAQLS